MTGITLEQVKERKNYLKAVTDVLEKDCTILKSDIDNLTKDILILEKANEFITLSIENKVSLVKDRVEELVNSGLNAIFRKDIQFQIKASVKYSKTVFDLVIKKKEVEGLTEAHGGGVLSLVAFILRVVVVMLSSRRRFIVFDESLSQVSAKYQPLLSEFISKLCKELDFTFVLISHQPLLSQYADIVYEAQDKGKETIFIQKGLKDGNCSNKKQQRVRSRKAKLSSRRK